MSKVWTEIDENQEPIRIFRSHKAMVLAMPYAECGYTVLMDRHSAVGRIRERIWKRQEGICLRCPKIITWNGMHLHEVESRGQGGEISIENSIALCYECHLGQRGVHQNRQLKFTKRAEKVE